MARIGLLGCVKKKQQKAAAFKDLYISPLSEAGAFMYRRPVIVGSFCPPSNTWEPDDVGEPYDQSLKTYSDTQRREWSSRVLATIDERLGDSHRLTSSRSMLGME